MIVWKVFKNNSFATKKFYIFRSLLSRFAETRRYFGVDEEQEEIGSKRGGILVYTRSWTA